MNICFLVNNAIHPQIGGVERVTYTLAMQLQKDNHKVYCVASNSTKSIKDLKQFLLPDNSNKLSSENIIFLNHLLKEKKIDIIINQSEQLGFLYLGFSAKKGLEIKFITVLHYAPDALLRGIRDSDRRDPRIWKNIFRTLKYPVSYFLRLHHCTSRYSQLYKMSDAVVLLSDNFADSFLKISKVKQSEKLFSISNPCDLSLPKETGEKKNQILFVGRMNFEAKRPDRMLKIWQKLHNKYPNWELVMIGDGPDIGQLKNLSTSLSLSNVNFMGNIDPSDFYKESKILCLTSTHEGFGMVLIEAMQYGCVPIAFNSFASLKDIIVDKNNGLHVEPFNIEDFADKIEMLIQNEERRLKMAKNGTTSLKKFDVQNISKKWTDLFYTI